MGRKQQVSRIFETSEVKYFAVTKTRLVLLWPVQNRRDCIFKIKEMARKASFLSMHCASIQINSTSRSLSGVTDGGRGASLPLAT